MIILLLTSCQSELLHAVTIPVAVHQETALRGIYHQIASGQTLWSIAQAYRVDVQTLVRVNHLPNANHLEAGQKLYIPGATRAQRVASRCPCGSLTPTATSSQPPSPVMNSRPVHIPSHTQDTAALKTATFLWPLRGEVSHSNAQDQARQHDGINIAAAKGTPIHAAADGKVVFSGWGPEGYGRMMILRHQADMVTVYAHNERNLVRSGEYVRQGDIIATVGRSGRAKKYHLYFEIRRKTVPVAPEKWLPSRQGDTAVLVPKDACMPGLDMRASSKEDHDARSPTRQDSHHSELS